MPVGGQAQRCVRTPRQGRTHGQVPVARARDVVGGNSHVGAGQAGLQRGRANTAAGAGARAAADRKVRRVQQPGAKHALGRAGVYTRAFGNHQVGCRRLHKPTVTAQAAPARAQTPGNVGAPGWVAQVRNHLNAPALACAVGRGVSVHATRVRNAVAGHQAHHAAVRHQARSVDHPAAFHHAGLQAVGRLCGQNDQTARGFYRVAVVHLRCNSGGADQNVGQSAFAADLQLVAVTRGQGHRAHLGQHHALVAHLGRQQGDVAAVLGAERALVYHAALGAITIQHVVARHKVSVADLVGGGGQRTHVHAGARCKVHAIGIAQKHLAVGIDLAKNLARRAA